MDFNNSTLRILQLAEKGDGLNVAGWSEKNLPKDTFDNFEIIKPEKFKETFNLTMETVDGKINGKKVVISIPENKVFTRVISIPEIEPSKAAEAVKWEAESNIPISIDEVYYDWQIIRKSNKKMDVLMVATPKKIIDNYLFVMDKIGVEVVACEAESIATGRSVIEKTNLGFVLVIDLGLDSTSFAVYQGTMPIFTSSSSINGRIFTGAVEKKLGLTYERAEAYKIKNGLIGQDKDENIEIFNSVLLVLSQEIEKTVNFFNNSVEGGKEAQINKIILTGGASNLKGLPEHLSNLLKKEVSLSDPWVNLKFKKKEKILSQEKSQSLATVIGLSIRAQDYESYN